MRDQDAVDGVYPFRYTDMPYQIQQTAAFANWLSNLRDVRAKSRILLRLRSALLGNLGDVRSVGAVSARCELMSGPATAITSRCGIKS